ncbi:hypothetical protein GTP46_08790 [Duganella sp. FT135W]|uniref:Uncharacterized protein n=1 Tax=Duganella flavida TaxID=2692175 RepID=A0A6L8K5G3_9BURK|nr:hypothetical protein [Duganella flavida]MYM22739.1 hypothetical protein [Duganella flavida]
MKIKKPFMLAALLVTGAAHAATPQDANMFFCARAAMFAESYTERLDAQKSRQESLAGAVADLNVVFKQPVDEGTLKLLMPWAAMADKLPGYKPYTKGSYVAVSCMAALNDAVFVPFQKPEIPPIVRNFLDACEAKGAREAVGQCIKGGFTSLPLEKLDK